MLRTKTKTPAIPFHKINLYKQFKKDGNLFCRINSREGMDENGQKRRFNDSDLVTPI